MKNHKTHLFGILLSLALMLGVMSILEMGTPIYAYDEPVISIEPEGSGTVSITDTSHDDGDYWKMTPSPNERFAFFCICHGRRFAILTMPVFGCLKYQ